ncbi:hypothetical protein O3M35_003705 [Rhynocoris fuscipes]|uniref:Uncharacterized protein n=1 Tax=Rhynocoris fuscipes TaxID=488301 RepID=A0AAW1CG09_9HEMI
MLSATDEKYNFDMVYQSLKEPIIIQSLDKHFGLFKAHFRVEKRIFRKFLQEKCCFIVRNRRYYRAMAKHATVLAQSHDNRRLIAECDQIYGLLKKLKEIKIKPVFKAYTARLKFKDNDKIFPSIWRTSQGGHVIFYPPVSFTMYRIPETGEHVSPAFIELQYNAIKPITNSALDEYGMLSKLLAASPASLINRDRMISLTNREAAADQVPILQIWFWWRWRMHWNPLNWSDQVVHSILQKAAPLLPELIEDKQIGYKKLEFREQYRQDMYDEITYTVLDHVFRVTYFMMFKEHTTWKGWQHREELAIPHRMNKEFYRPYAFSELVTRDIKKFYEEHMLKWFNGLSEKYFDGDYLESAPPSKLHVIVMKEMLIDYIIEIATNIRQTAAIYIKLIYRNGQVTLVPDIDDIMASHSEMIRNVANLMLNMEFREFVKEDVVRKPNTIKTGWIDDYVLKKILELKMKLQPLFYALERYSDKLDKNDFAEKIYGELDPKIVFSQPLNDKPPFKSLYGQCKHYKQMLKSIRLLPEHEYLSIFIINQATFKMQVAALCTLRLKEASVVAKNFIITDAKMICDTLNELIRRMNKTIDDTEELFRMGGYTTHGIHDTVRALRTQLMKCVNRIFIIEYGLDIRDIMAIRDLILTYNALHHAMENFKIAYESSRMEKEDKLLKATEKLNRDLEEFYSMYIDNFSDLDDITKIDEYVNFLRIYKWRMRDFDKRVLWINKEETLFNIPTSTYPELDEIKALINPFAELISFISDFTRQYRIWMEGPLQALNPITLEKELDAYMKTLFVYNRTFKQKCRLHQSENYPKRFRGHVDDPEYNAWPAPIKLIYVLQNQMKELKVI